jgi:hypothetical protein
MTEHAPAPDLSDVATEVLIEEVVRRGSAAVVMVRVDDPPAATHLLIGADTVASYGLARVACQVLERDLAAEVFGDGHRAG